MSKARANTAAPHRLIRAAAGAGKTYQLTTRYLSLLRLGAVPAHILATTFTRKAAGEILGRVLNRLAQALEDADALARLDADLKREPAWRDFGDGSALTRARCQAMLDELIGSLHRINVSTLDSFFHRITRSFALELDAPLEPILLDDRGPQAEQLRLEAIEAMLGEAAGGVNEGDDLEAFVALLREVHHEQLKRSVTQSINDLVADLYEVYREADDPALWSKLLPTGLLDETTLHEAIDALAEMEEALPLAQRGTPRHRWAEALGQNVHDARLGEWEDFLRRGIASKLAAGETHFDRLEIDDAWLAVYQPVIAHARGELVRRLASQTRSTYELIARFDRHYTDLRRRRSVMMFSDLSHLLARGLPRLGPAVMSEVYFRLDGRVNHLLIDEFQDTSLNQWQVLAPLVEEVTAPDAQQRSAFIVGDTKQSIYGWRGGCAELFDDVQAQLKPRGLTTTSLNESYRSSPVVLEAVNAVFGSLTRNPALDDDVDALERWQGQFEAHAAAKPVAELPGHVLVMSSKAPDADETGDATTLDDEADEDSGAPGAATDAHFGFVARGIADLHARAPQHAIGVLVRRNSAAAALLYELRRLGVDASGEGGHPVTDIPAVAAVLAAITLADHPGDEVAAFHVAHSPVGEMLELRDPTDARRVREVSMHVRHRLLADGYAETLSEWAGKLAPACDARGLDRLSRLIQLAERYEQELAQPLRPRRFVDFAAATAVEEPSGAAVRVMTIHAAKGLEFDAVVLPELDGSLVDRTQVLVDRETPTGPVRAVYRNPRQELRKAIPEVDRAYEQYRQRKRFEDLCTLYVAMTRARQALHIYVKPRKVNKQGQPGALPRSLASVVRTALRDEPAKEENPAGGEILYARGGEHWMGAPKDAASSADAAKQAPPVLRLQLAKAGEQPRRSWLSISPSSMEAAGRVCGADLLDLGSAGARQRGTLVHAWMEQVGFVDQPDAVPDDAALLEVARRRMPELTRERVQAMLAAFRQALEEPAVRDALQSHGAEELWREHAFALRWEGKLMRGTFDRVAVRRDADGTPLGATLLDFKTDRIADPAQRDEAVQRYAPQLAAYRAALARLLAIEPVQITARLVFFETGEVIDAPEEVAART